MLKVKELAGKSEEELGEVYETVCAEVFELLNELRTSRKLEKPHLLREKKRDRARVLTVLRQKQKKTA